MSLFYSIEKNCHNSFKNVQETFLRIFLFEQNQNFLFINGRSLAHWPTKDNYYENCLVNNTRLPKTSQI